MSDRFGVTFLTEHGRFKMWVIAEEDPRIIYTGYGRTIEEAGLRACQELNSGRNGRLLGIAQQGRSQAI